MSNLTALPLTTVQKMRLLARTYEGVLVMQVHHFGLSCKITHAGFTIAFPIKWEVIESSSMTDLIYIIGALANEKPDNAGRHHGNC